jgi:hypothetical protein
MSIGAVALVIAIVFAVVVSTLWFLKVLLRLRYCGYCRVHKLAKWSEWSYRSGTESWTHKKISWEQRDLICPTCGKTLSGKQERG